MLIVCIVISVFLCYFTTTGSSFQVKIESDNNPGLIDQKRMQHGDNKFVQFVTNGLQQKAL